MSIVNGTEVRVTAKDTTKSPFIAPDMAPVPTVQLELAKSEKGWTNRKAKVKLGEAAQMAKAEAKRARKRQDTVRVGRSVVRKRSGQAMYVVPVTGPSESHKAMRERAARLAERDGFSW
jgi:hypothetical protein